MSVTFPMAAWATRLRTGCVLLSLVSLLGGCDAERSTSPSSPSRQRERRRGDRGRGSLDHGLGHGDLFCPERGSGRQSQLSQRAEFRAEQCPARRLYPDGEWDLRGPVPGPRSGKPVRPHHPVRLGGRGHHRPRLVAAMRSAWMGPGWWVFRGFTIDRGLKGIMADRAHDNVYERLDREEHRRRMRTHAPGSSRNIIRDNYIHHCGATSQYGEGIYIGSSPNNDDNDQANDNEILDNTDRVHRRGWGGHQGEHRRHRCGGECRSARPEPAAAPCPATRAPRRAARGATARPGHRAPVGLGVRVQRHHPGSDVQGADDPDL